MEYMTKSLLHVTCRCRLRRWPMIGKGVKGGGGAMDVNAAGAGEVGRGREIVMYVLWGDVGGKWRWESDI